MQRIAITGSSGYYGRKLIEHARRVSPESRLLGIDVVPPRESPPDEFFQADIRSPDVRAALAKFQPDTIVHLAFVVNPMRDNRKMSDINIGGTNNVFEAVRAIRPQRFLIASSATAYGAWPDNPVPIHEDWRLKPRENFQYVADKTAIEASLQSLAEDLPDVAVAWTRPVIIGGKGASNYLSRFVLNIPIIFLPDGEDVPLHFVHEEDCVSATWHILQHDARGPFNVGPPDCVPLTKLAALTNRRVAKLPFWTMKLATTIWWGLRLPLFDFPPSLHDFVRYPWVVSPARLQNELGFQFRYSSEETLLEMWAEHRRKKTRQ
jgi:UDP-glucose 4-epimerase